MNIPVFYCERTGRERLSLRRYATGPCGDGGAYSFHNAKVIIGEARDDGAASGDIHPHDDPRWPKNCEHCGRAFEDDDHWQLFREDIYVRPDTGEEFVLGEAPVGACWNADWMTEGKEPGSGFHIGDDGRCLFVRLPPDNHDWCIDARARNCTLPDDHEHKCWVRHGRPEDGTLHVDKNGRTCAAGAGSIGTGKWHGFLHNGHLTEC